MLIDWFTVIAQALNFLILVWLMKKFLYKPILDAIEAREKKIANEIANANKKKEEAEKESEKFKRKNEEFDKERAELIIQAQNEAKAEAKRLKEDAKEDADISSAKRKESLRNEIKNLDQAISNRVQEEVLSITKKVLTDLSGISLEEHMVTVFIQKLKELSTEAKQDLIRTIEMSTTKLILINTAFDLDTEKRSAIEKAVKESVPIETKLQFKTKAELISGIELSIDGQKIAWSIGEHLSSLQEKLNELVGTKKK